MVEFGDSRLPPRFWNKVKVVDCNLRPDLGPCWEWTGFRDRDGYGRFVTPHGQNAHRISYETLVGPIPVGLEPDHLCRNTGCVNPSHIEPVTHQENVRRGDIALVQRERAKAITHCPRGHPYDEQNTRFDKEGRRNCKICVLERNRAAVKAKQKPCPVCGKPCTGTALMCRQCRMKNSKRTLVSCPQGHPYTPENIYIYRGARSCKTCRVKRAMADTARKRGVPFGT